MKSFNEFINESKNAKGKLKLVFVGDIMQHQKQLDYQNLLQKAKTASSPFSLVSP